MFGQHFVYSHTGVRQGDPLEPLLFSLALQPIALKLAALGRSGNFGKQLDLCFFYLEDGLLAGDVDAVSEALSMLQTASSV